MFTYFVRSESQKLELVERFTSLTHMFPPNAQLDNNLDLIKTLGNDLKTSRDVAPPEINTLLDWFSSAVKKTAIYLKEYVYKTVYWKWGSAKTIKSILDHLIGLIKLLNLCVTRIVEFRDEVGTREVSRNEQEFLSSLHDALFTTIKFLQAHLDNDEVYLLTKTFCTERRPDYITSPLNLSSEEIETCNDYACIKSVEILLSLSELVACAALEFGFRITYSELLRSDDESCLCGPYFYEFQENICKYRINLQTAWNDCNEKQILKPDSDDQDIESEIMVELAMADKFSREYKLWKNSEELSRIGSAMLEDLNAVSMLSKSLVYNSVKLIPEEATESNIKFRKDCENHISTMTQQSILNLAKLIRLSSVNEEIIKAMQNVNCKGTTISTQSVLQAETHEEYIDCVSDNEITEDATATVYEHGQDELSSRVVDEDPFGQKSKNFEVYQLKVRTNSEEDVHVKEDIYEWGENANEVKATHKFVMSELKEVLVGVKDVMTKRENEAFREKYGYEEPTEEVTYENALKEENFEAGGSGNETELQNRVNHYTTFRKSKTVICLSRDEGSDIHGQPCTRTEDLSMANGINLVTFARPNFAPLVDEYILNDDGSESEDNCEDN